MALSPRTMQTELWRYNSLPLQDTRVWDVCVRVCTVKVKWGQALLTLSSEPAGAPHCLRDPLNGWAGLSSCLTSPTSIPLHEPCVLASGTPSLSCVWTLLLSVLQEPLSWYCHLVRTKPFLWHNSDGFCVMVSLAPPLTLSFPVLCRSLGT